MIRTEKLGKSFGEFWALKGIDFELKPGEVVGVIGPSGSGKSTFVRCLNFLEVPTQGKVFFKDREIQNIETELRSVRKKMGMVFQHFNLFPHLTVEENLTLAPRKVLGLSDAESRTEAKKYLEMVGLSEHTQKQPQELSGGQKQRVAIARTLIMQPELMLFDEPTSALDPETIGEVLNCLRPIREQGVAQIIVTHEIHFIRAFADRILFFDEGELVEEGSGADFFSHPKTERLKRFLKALDY